MKIIIPICFALFIIALSSEASAYTYINGSLSINGTAAPVGTLLNASVSPFGTIGNTTTTESGLYSLELNYDPAIENITFFILTPSMVNYFNRSIYVEGPLSSDELNPTEFNLAFSPAKLQILNFSIENGYPLWISNKTALNTTRVYVLVNNSGNSTAVTGASQIGSSSISIKSGNTDVTSSFLIQRIDSNNTIAGNSQAAFEFSIAAKSTLVYEGIMNVSATLAYVDQDVGSQVLVNASGYNSTLFSVDSIDPTVVLTKDHSDATVKNGDTVVFTATFTEDNSTISETNKPNITITTSGSCANVSATDMTKSTNLIWTYNWVIPASCDGTAIIGINATDVAGNRATAPTGAGAVTYTIDNTAPRVDAVSSTNADGPYKAGAQVNITVVFNETVAVTGTPIIRLDSSGIAYYLSGENTTTLTFNYTIGAGQNSSDLTYNTTTSLNANSGTIKDAAGNDATLTLASPTAAGSLGNAKALVIDTTAPTLSLNAPTNNSALSSGTTSVLFNISTNETSICRYSSNSQVYASMTNLTSTNSTLHTVTVSGLSSGSSYSYYFKCSDAAGNINADNFSVQFSVTAAATTTISSSSGGGGLAPIVTETSSMISASAGSTTNVSFSQSNRLGIQNITISTANAFTNAQITIKETTAASAGVSVAIASADGAVYKYLEITKTNIQNSDISSAIISFKVSKSWLTANKIDKSTIALNRFSNGWSKLPTTITSEDSTYVYFTSTTPGFSTFAITGSKGASFFDVLSKIDAYYKGTATFFDVIGVIDLYYKAQGVVA